jgi:acetyltransferase-like isoleucine patch superfamily enzyme
MNRAICDFSKIGDCDIHKTAEICFGSIIGKPYRRFLDGTRDDVEKTLIASNVYIGCYSIIGNGSVISDNAIIDDYCLIESRVRIGNSTLVTNRAQICNDVSVGKNCVIGGFIGERTIVGDHCRVFGKIVHNHNNPCLGWDDDEAMENAPVIGNSVFIGFNALIIGGVKIEEKVFVCAGSIVTKDIPAFHIASGKNNFTHYLSWLGALKDSNHFCERI